MKVTTFGVVKLLDVVSKVGGLVKFLSLFPLLLAPFMSLMFQKDLIKAYENFCK